MTYIICNASFNVHHAEIEIQTCITSSNTHNITYYHTNTLNLPFSTHFHHQRMNCCAVLLSCYWPQGWCEVPCQRRHWDKIEHAVSIVRNLTCNERHTRKRHFSALSFTELSIQGSNEDKSNYSKTYYLLPSSPEASDSQLLLRLLGTLLKLQECCTYTHKVSQCCIHTHYTLYLVASASAKRCRAGAL